MPVCLSVCLSFGLSAELNFHNRVLCLFSFVKLVLFLKKQNVLKLCDITSTKGYAHSSVCPSFCLSLSPSVCPSIHPSVHWSPYNHFAWQVKKMIASDLCSAYGVVINLEMVGQECLSAYLYACQSICLSLKTAAHASLCTYTAGHYAVLV